VMSERLTRKCVGYKDFRDSRLDGVLVNVNAGSVPGATFVQPDQRVTGRVADITSLIAATTNSGSSIRMWCPLPAATT
jgi:hypothetical protein